MKYFNIIDVKETRLIMIFHRMEALFHFMKCQNHTNLQLLTSFYGVYSFLYQQLKFVWIRKNVEQK